MNIKKIAKSIGASAKKNAPKLLTGASVGGSLVTIILTVRATNKSRTRIDDIKECYTSEGAQEPTLTKKDVVKATWKYYIPVALSFAATTACTICSNVESNKREAAALALYSVSQKAYDEYKSIVHEEVGEKKANEIQEKLAEQTMANDGIMLTGNGAYLFKDVFTGQYFRSTPEIVEKVFDAFDNLLSDGEPRRANELYSMLGWPQKRLPDVGKTHWFQKESVEEVFLPCFDYSASDWGEPCCELIFPVDPIRI